jgi:uncharacterized protein
MNLQANGFDWDKGNRAKCERHGAFDFRYRRPFHPSACHSPRCGGRTDKGRGVFIVFTLRRKGEELLIRPISARYMHKKEIEAYEKENPDL